jgi:DNA-binding NarL/FixJ family response regulator
MVAAARARNAQAFAPWSKDEEQEILRRFKAGDSVEAIAKARKRSVRAIELRLQRLGALPPA